jgi:hypothetical protein
MFFPFYQYAFAQLLLRCIFVIVSRHAFARVTTPRGYCAVTEHNRYPGLWSLRVCDLLGELSYKQ